jgi:hypothetical protein
LRPDLVPEESIDLEKVAVSSPSIELGNPDGWQRSETGD